MEAGRKKWTFVKKSEDTKGPIIELIQDSFSWQRKAVDEGDDGEEGQKLVRYRVRRVFRPESSGGVVE